MAKSKVVITEDMVDELVTVREKLRALTAREKELKEMFREGGAATYSSKNCAVEITFTSKMILDSEKVRAFIGPKKLPEFMKPSEQMNIKTMELV
jgi:hypothetical protein